MRLKEDDTSWKAFGIKHRDNRHDKSTQEVTRRKSTKKKNKRKWCKGREGIEHDLIWRVAKRYNSIRQLINCKPIKEIACSVCNKSFDLDFKFTGSKENIKSREEQLIELKEKLYGRVA